MIQNLLFKILVSPIALLYGIGVSLRDFFYRKGLLKGVEFGLPLISVGNLSIGGAGKTPHIEYLVRLLNDYIDVATLSRGYQRKTKGFLTVSKEHSAEQVGDEPLQFKRKFADIMVAVSESRIFAIPRMLTLQPDLQLVLLDDAYQHLSVKPGLNILLTEYNYPFTRDYLLPSGRLREWRSAYRRADFIIVSKCPPDLSVEQQTKMTNEIAPFKHQKIFFSFYKYLQPYYIFNKNYTLKLDESIDILLVSAIARTEYLTNYLENNVNSVRILEYEDHHYFSKYDVSYLHSTFKKINASRKIIITTEKDAMRLELHKRFIMENQIPVFVLPIEVDFHFDDKQHFDQSIKQFLLDFKG